MERVDLKGRRYGRLLVIGEAEKKIGSKNRHVRWVCLCSCGNQVIVYSDKLTNGITKSCGCLKIDTSIKTIREYNAKTKHLRTGRDKSRAHLRDTYRHMVDRCYNPNNPKYKNYGGRGITVCQEWLSDKNRFFAWAMGNGYAVGLSLERIDVNGNYEPQNCAFIPMPDQAMNKTNTVRACIEGEYYTISQLAELTGIKYGTIWARLKSGKTGRDIIKEKR